MIYIFLNSRLFKYLIVKKIEETQEVYSELNGER